MRFELTTFSLARRRSTTELRPHNGEALISGWEWRPKRWTRSDSNRRSPPCKGGAFPLGHGPAPGDVGADERTRTSTTFRSTDPKSVASANSATSAHVGTNTSGNKWEYSRFCSKPPSVSHPAGCGGSWLAGRYPTSPSPLRRDQTRLGLAHSPCSQLHARLAGRVAPNRWWALIPPFHPLPAPAKGRPLAGLLSVAVVVAMPLPAWRPHLLFREATLPPRGGGESGSSSTGADRQRRRSIYFRITGSCQSASILDIIASASIFVKIRKMLGGRFRIEPSHPRIRSAEMTF